MTQLLPTRTRTSRSVGSRPRPRASLAACRRPAWTSTASTTRRRTRLLPAPRSLRARASTRTSDRATGSGLLPRPLNADTYAPGVRALRTRGTEQLAPGPHAKCPRRTRTCLACRTYRVPCGAPQAAGAAPPDEPLGHATRLLLRQRADACAASLRKARGDAYSGAAAAALLAACAALERDDASAVREEVPWSQLPGPGPLRSLSVPFENPLGPLSDWWHSSLRCRL